MVLVIPVLVMLMVLVKRLVLVKPPPSACCAMFCSEHVLLATGDLGDHNRVSGAIPTPSTEPIMQAYAIAIPRVSPRAARRTLVREPRIAGGIVDITATRVKSGKNKGAVRVQVDFLTSLFNPGTEGEHSPARRAQAAAQVAAQKEYFLACAIDAGFAGKNAKATIEAYAFAKVMQAEADYTPPAAPLTSAPTLGETLIMVSREAKRPQTGESLGTRFYLIANPAIRKTFAGLQIDVDRSTQVAISIAEEHLDKFIPEGAHVIQEWEYLNKIAA